MSDRTEHIAEAIRKVLWNHSSIALLGPSFSEREARRTEFINDVAHAVDRAVSEENAQLREALRLSRPWVGAVHWDGTFDPETTELIRKVIDTALGTNHGTAPTVSSEANDASR